MRSTAAVRGRHAEGLWAAALRVVAGEASPDAIDEYCRCLNVYERAESNGHTVAAAKSRFRAIWDG